MFADDTHLTFADDNIIKIEHNLKSVKISVDTECVLGHEHRYLIYTRWRIPHCRQTKIEAGLQALVLVLTELTRSMIICVFFIAEIDKVDNKFPFMQLKSI